MGVIKIHLPPASSALPEPFCGILGRVRQNQERCCWGPSEPVPAHPTEGQVAPRGLGWRLGRSSDAQVPPLGEGEAPASCQQKGTICHRPLSSEDGSGKELEHLAEG